MQNDAKSSITWWGKGFLKELQNTACLFLRFQGKTVKEGNEPSFKYPATCFPSAIFESGSCPWKYWDKKFAFIDIFISKARIGWHIICIYVTNCQNHPRNPRFMLSKFLAIWKEKYALGSCNLLFCKTKNYILVNTLFLRYESSTLILYKELSSSIIQSLSVSQWVSEWVRQASVTPVQISTFCNI